MLFALQNRTVMIENESIACRRVSDAAILNVKTVTVIIMLQHWAFCRVEVDLDRLRLKKLFFLMLKCEF